MVPFQHKNVGAVTILLLCSFSDHALYLYQVLWKYLSSFQSYWADTIPKLKFSKCIIPWKMLVELWFLIFTKFLWKYFKGFQSFWADTLSKLKFFKGNNSIKCKWSYGSCSLHIAWWCFIFLPSSMKISLRVSKLLRGHNFHSEIFQGE